MLSNQYCACLCVCLCVSRFFRKQCHHQFQLNLVSMKMPPSSCFTSWFVQGEKYTQQTQNKKNKKQKNNSWLNRGGGKSLWLKFKEHKWQENSLNNLFFMNNVKKPDRPLTTEIVQLWPTSAKNNVWDNELLSFCTIPLLYSYSLSF